MSSYGALAWYYDELTRDVPYELFADYYERLFAEDGGEFRLLLDLCCGTGSLPCLMARRGYEMIGADASPEMLMEAMAKDCGHTPTQLQVDGGASANGFLMQFQADILDKAVHRPKLRETTALGAAYLAGLAVGYWSSQEEIARNWAVDRTFLPAITTQERDKKHLGWKRAVTRAFDWEEA